MLATLSEQMEQLAKLTTLQLLAFSETESVASESCKPRTKFMAIPFMVDVTSGERTSQAQHQKALIVLPQSARLVVLLIVRALSVSVLSSDCSSMT